MTNRDSAVLAFRLLGVWFVAYALIGLANLPYAWDSTQDETRRLTIAAICLPSLVTLGIGVLIWMSAEWFAARIFAVAPAHPLGSDPLRGEMLLATAFAIIGTFLIAESLPALVSSVALFVQSYTATTSILGRDSEQQHLLWSAAVKANTAAGITRLVIGLALLAGPARLSAAVASIRKDLRGTLDDAEGPGNGPTP
jgi:hypothetical protein